MLTICFKKMQFVHLAGLVVRKVLVIIKSFQMNYLCILNYKNVIKSTVRS
jgi:hypothetical protein